ncbi:DNA cytosine methyltransferase [Streptosporangium canum]|uniref:DNA cytosine methyltransferase n=1 Tax=Streptosporangium canum TaxID=324952 RepID=UPI0036775953
MGDMNTAAAIPTTHLLAGGGGDLTGFAEAGLDPMVAVNHLPEAIATILANHSRVRGLVEDVVRLNMCALPSTPVVFGSPICTEAAPSGRRSRASQLTSPWDVTRSTAWCLLRMAEVHNPAVVAGENVLDFVTRWQLFESWFACWEALGYVGHLVCVDSAHLCGPGNLAAPQRRERVLFIFAKRGIRLDLTVSPPATCQACGPVTGVRAWKPTARHVAGFPIGTYGPRGAYTYRCPTCKTQAEPLTQPMAPGIDWSLPMTYVRDGRPDRKTFTPYVPNTQHRIQAGLDALGGEPFVVICRKNKTFDRLDGPVSTVTAEGNHHMLVLPGPDGTVGGCQVRMFSTAEKAYAQRFPRTYRFITRGTQAVGGLLVGNAVSVNTGRWLGERIRYALAA